MEVAKKESTPTEHNHGGCKEGINTGRQARLKFAEIARHEATQTRAARLDAEAHERRDMQVCRACVHSAPLVRGDELQLPQALHPTG